MCRTVPIALSNGNVAPGDRVFSCHVSRECPPGITLSDEAGAVRVLRVHKDDAAHQCGIRANDRVTSINALPCRSHKEAVRVWEAIFAHAKKINQPVVARCVVERHSRRRSCI